MLQKYCIALEDIVYWAQLSARAAPRRTEPDTGQDKMLREGKIMVTSLYQSLCNMETIYADRVAIRYYDEAKQGVTEVYYRQYAQDLRRFVSFLRSKAGDVKGQRVAILARNSYHYVICMYGTVLAGGVAVPLNMGKNWDEIQYELDLVEPVCVLQDGEYLQREPALADAYSAKLEPMDVFTAFAPAQDVKEVEDLAAMAFIMFTSGTTGRSKGVMLSQKNLFSAMPAFLDPFDDVKKYTGWNTDEFSSLSALPMFHISAMTSLVSWSITGHSINLCNNLKYFYRDLGAMHSEVMAVVPVLLKSIYSDVMKGRRERLNGLRVLTCGAAMFDPKMRSDLMDKGFFVAQMYGLTETCGDGAWNSSQEAKHLTSVGHVDLSCEYKLDDGELCMRGNPIMLGYYKDPEGTAEVIDADGWFHTGDIARVEEDGYMYLTGRKKNVIILDSGENVSPEELEKLLVPCADIQECIVKEKDKKICAVIYCDPAKQDAVKEFVTGVNRGLPLYKRMVTQFSAQPLPRNAMGKLLR